MPREPSELLRNLNADTLAVARAMALAWTWRTRTTTYDLLRHLASRTAAGRAFTQEHVKLAHVELRKAGVLLEQHGRPGYWRLTDPVRNALYRDVLDQAPVETLRDALRQCVPHYYHTRMPFRWPSWDPGLMVALLRLELLSGASTAAIQQIQREIGVTTDWTQLIRESCVEAFDESLFERIVPPMRWAIAHHALDELCEFWDLEGLAVCRWALRALDTPSSPVPAAIRARLAETLLHRGEAARARALLEGDTGAIADALRAAMLVQEGRWAEGQAAFEAALKRRQAETGARKHLLPISLAWLYPLALLAQQTPKHLEAARKFCAGESGSRNPERYLGWGIWVHAIAVRVGDATLDPMAFEPMGGRGDVDCSDLWRLLLRAWLGSEAFRASAKKPASADELKHRAAMRTHLERCELGWLKDQVRFAEAVIAGDQLPTSFFAGGACEAWRTVLASLAALGEDTSRDAESQASRILWSIQLDKAGGIEAIEPMERKRGARGWLRPKLISLARIASNQKLEPWDVKVARAIRKDRFGARQYSIDRSAAIQALVGHPAVVLSDALDTTVDVVEGTPEMEVVRIGERYVLRITPDVHPEPEPDTYRYYMDESEKRESEALRYVTVLRDSPQRIRVVRLTAAQRRAAQLVSGRFAVPAEGKADLERALQAISGHFQIHSDHAQAAREIASEARLRAELAPSGDGVTLRLVVAPLGPAGPRLRPGAGRTRIMAAVNGDSIGTERDLDAERQHLDDVLAGFDFLDPPARGDVACEWLIEEPEQALSVVETLPTIAAVHAIDWPRGQPVKVVTVGAAQLALTVRTERDWFGLTGRIAVDEGRVFELEALLAAATGRSRFVPMGKGVYAALTKELRDKLAEMAAVAERSAGNVRVPQLAAAWLDDVLEGVSAERDAGFVDKIERLRAAQQTLPAVPGNLQTTLRPYQEDGYAWARRLAEAGFGACLADDMGLGKTIQALAVLLARAEGGPALVVAPTSVCGNWLAETQRFAPTLNPMIYGEGDRSAVIESAGPHDLVIVSYTLMQQAQEAFAARTWHTLIADEAQAIKNASAKRSLALFDLPAGFRMALSGTPIENRLAELWSIMRYCNPGLLGTLSRFNERFAGPIERSRDRDAQRVLRRLIAPFVLRRTKSQVLQDLPARTELILTIAPEAEEAAHYEALRRVAVAAAERVAQSEQAGQAQFHILAQLTRLRRAACDPRLTSPDLGIVGAKVRAFAELAGELAANNHKALVFSQFVDFLTLLRAPLDEAGIPYQYLDGSTPAAERARRVAAFQSGAGDLFLISLKAGGFGLNLTAADYVVITDPWWNPAAEDQAMGRAHRIGQLRPVTVYRLVGKSTVEERIVELHHDKRSLAEGVLAEGGEAATLPSTDELIALLRGESPQRVPE